MRIKSSILVAPALALVVASAPAGAQTTATGDDLTELSLEALMEVEIHATSAARKPQAVWDTPAAVHVLTQEDLRRAGATSIPEALRLVPGVQVARLDANRWAISIRGFNDEFANKLLVLVDGRSVYTPFFGGVYWDVQDLDLDDVERIEVVRGPNAAMWGVNAVNGVINVITKPASRTQGARVTVLAGTEDRALTSVRVGGAAGEHAHWRVWASYRERDSSELSTGGAGPDDGRYARAGFRADGSRDDDQWTVQGDVYGGVAGSLNLTSREVETEVAGANLLGRWTRELGEGSSFALQAYADRNERYTETMAERRDTLDLDFQHRLPLGERQDLLWGLGLRSTSSVLGRGFDDQVDDPRRGDAIATAFVQDEIELVADELALTVGARWDHADAWGSDVSPNARLMWHATEDQAAWAAVSGAHRSPSQIEEDARVLLSVIPGPPDVHVTLFGNDDLEPEGVLAYEVGYRQRFGERLTLDATAFLDEYEDLIVTEAGTPFFQGTVVVAPQNLVNAGGATVTGFEVAIDWQASDALDVHAGYSLLHVDFDQVGNALDSGEATEGKAPRHQAYLSCRRDLGPSWELDGTLYVVDDLATGDVPGYARIDGRLAWRSQGDVDVVLGVQNVLHDDQPEFGPSPASQSGRVELAAYLLLRWSF